MDEPKNPVPSPPLTPASPPLPIDDTDVITDPIRVNQRLRELGIAFELVEDAVSAWSAAEASATPFEPITAPGTKGWIAAIGVLREGQALKSWRTVNVRCWPIIVSPDGKLAFTATTGDIATGCATRTPQTKNRKGIVVAIAVGRNSEQLSLFGPRLNVTPIVQKRSRNHALTWVLLVRVTADNVYAEVSLPSLIQKRKIVKWKERLILQPLPRVPEPRVRRSEERFDQQVDIEVPIARKG